MENRSKERMAMGRLMRVNRLHRSTIEKLFKELGVHRSQHMMLVYLESTEPTPSQKQIAEHFDVTAAAVAMSLKKMEKNGLIERSASFHDNRVNIINVSEKGKDVLKRTRALFNEMDNAAFDGMSDEEMDTLIEMLERVTQNLMKKGAVDDCHGKCGAQKK